MSMQISTLRAKLNDYRDTGYDLTVNYSRKKDKIIQGKVKYVHPQLFVVSGVDSDNVQKDVSFSFHDIICNKITLK